MKKNPAAVAPGKLHCAGLTAEQLTELGRLIAGLTAEQLTELGRNSGKHPIAVAFGKLRAARLTAEQLTEIGRKGGVRGSKARWEKWKAAGKPLNP